MKYLAIVAVGLLGLSVSACGNSDSSPPAGPAVQVVSGSRARTFRSFDELREASSLIVHVKVDAKSSRNEVDVDGLPMTSSAADVKDVLGGANPKAVRVDDSIRIRQVGGQRVFVDDAPSGGLLEPGSEYVLFLDEFELERGKPTGEYVVVGTYAGIFEVKGNTMVRLDPDSTDIPSEYPLSDLSELIHS